MRRRDFLRTASGLLVPATCAGQILSPIVHGKASPPVLPQTGLVAEYNCVQGADASVLYDVSGANRHGTLTGSVLPEYGTTGLDLAAASSQYAYCTNANVRPAQYTIALAFKAPTPFSGVTPMFAWSITTNNFVQFNPGSPANKIVAKFGNSASRSYNQTPVNGRDGNWHVYVMTCNGAMDGTVLFVDGSAIDINATAVASFNVKTGLYLGAQAGSAFSTCTVGYVSVWNAVLGSSAIAQAGNYIRAKMAARSVILPLWAGYTLTEPPGSEYAGVADFFASPVVA